MNNLIKTTIYLLLISIASLTSAQGIQFGAKAGANLANVTGETGTTTSMLTGFHAGGFVDFSLSDKFSLVPELIYSTGGVKEKFSETTTILGIVYSANFEQEINLSYIDLPVLATYKLHNGLYFNAGAYIGILMSAKKDVTITEYVSGSPVAVVDTSYSIKSITSSTDLGLAFGLGYKLEGGLCFSARYSLGLTDLNKDNTGSDPVKNAVIGISVSYIFPKE